jgi:hypothetical protein
VSASALGDLLGQRELWVACASSLIFGLAVVFAGWKQLHLVLVLVVAAISVNDSLATVLAFAVAFGAGQMVHDRAATVSAVALSVLAVGGAYATTPDTERSVVALGAVGSLGAVALLFRHGWASLAAALTILLGWIALTDGRPRASAVVATLGIAAVHAGFQWLDGQPAGRASTLALVLVAAVTTGVLSRVAGMMSGSLQPTALTTGVAAMSLTAGAAIVGMSRRQPLE